MAVVLTPLRSVSGVSQGRDGPTSSDSTTPSYLSGDVPMILMEHGPGLEAAQWSTSAPLASLTNLFGLFSEFKDTEHCQVFF